jgi:tetratricopeptide (TPR) repeat protein
MTALRSLLHPPQASAAEATAADVEQLVGEASQMAAKEKPEAHAAWLEALGETCLIHKKQSEADRYFAEAAEVLPSAGSLIRVADSLRNKQQHLDAADWYGRAGQQDETPHIALYLQGWSLAKAGRDEEGQRLMRQARLLPLSDSGQRRVLAGGMFDRGLRDEAIDEWKLMVRIGPLRDWSTNNAAMLLGNALSKQQHHQVADLWQRLLLSALSTNTGFLETGGYLRVPHLIHKKRALGSLEEGELDAAIREVELARRALPGDTAFALSTVPELESAGCLDAADALFEKVHNHVARVCEAFPNSAAHHNNLAWMSAKCGRRLEEALKHAEEAVKLSPDKAAYVDTLAEVHFQRGDRDEAIRHIRRCIELEPDRQYFHDQLTRFGQE